MKDISCIYFNPDSHRLLLEPISNKDIVIFNFEKVKTEYNDFSVGDIVFNSGNYSLSRFTQIKAIYPNQDRIETCIDEDTFIRPMGSTLTDFCNSRIVVVKRDVIIEFFKRHNV
jgi:hypothetical protein